MARVHDDGRADGLYLLDNLTIAKLFTDMPLDRKLLGKLHFNLYLVESADIAQDKLSNGKLLIPFT